MAVKIITDTTSDLSEKYVIDNNVGIVRLKVLFGEESYTSGLDITTKEFYDKMEASAPNLPKTSQPSPSEVEEIFNESLADGDDIVAIFVSNKLSGTGNSAMLAKNMIGADNIYLVDSETVTFALAALVCAAVEMRDRGMSAKEIADELESLKKRVVLFATISNLKYLQMGGRLSAGSALLGTVLNVKPIITIEDGLVTVADKQRGQKKAFDSIFDTCEKLVIDETMPRFFAHTNMPSAMNELICCFKERFPQINANEFMHCDIGSTVGVHAGPGATGLSFFAKNI